MVESNGLPPLETTCQSVKSRLEGGEDFLLLDCRERDEHALVNITGARLMPMSELMGRAGELEPWRGKDVVVYCHHGGRSLQVAAWLRQRGFGRAQSMAGGIDAWASQIDTSLARY